MQSVKHMYENCVTKGIGNAFIFILDNLSYVPTVYIYQNRFDMDLCKQFILHKTWVHVDETMVLEM